MDRVQMHLLLGFGIAFLGIIIESLAAKEVLPKPGIYAGAVTAGAGVLYAAASFAYIKRQQSEAESYNNTQAFLSIQDRKEANRSPRAGSMASQDDLGLRIQDDVAPGGLL
ncbi:MAG: hypothetical protein K0Q57_290 [Gammaproteobacteria bacterium]|jgi:hypothetical protein|nr:hypothetical protein [Gammaproteobacteria bacterium]